MKIWKKPTCIDTAVAEADRLPAACAADAWAATAALNIRKAKDHDIDNNLQKNSFCQRAVAASVDSISAYF